MKIIDILKNNETTLSFEVFPPKRGEILKRAEGIINSLAQLAPDYISVTYGALGTNAENNLLLANEVEKHGITALAHMTCINSTKDKVLRELEALKKSNIKNILALRGDKPQDVLEVKSDFKYASDLIEFIKKNSDFCVGGACYPEGHPDSANIEEDINNLKKKVDAGCEFFVTQMFFDNSILYNFMYKLLRSKIEIPVVAGIMPFINANQVKGIVEISGTMLPTKFKAIVDKFGDRKEAMYQAGVAYAIGQIIDLIANGFKNIHLYTLNRPDVASLIKDLLSQII